MKITRFDDFQKVVKSTQIGLMVYKLYELTYEEVLVVEPEFGLSEQEYANFKIE